ncbi:hypothetical protein [Arthrobacter sp. ISL-30]|uniref:hypothetical protein n=1 Tax=Arthrobacter sp. ISL-30 TaxID=2819109 RepID=UPI001BE6BBE4|nr:hypothetical protein [Arthrobacter sp. ISL-30]MBT2515319.1 hypothetical protein [Arthrobacter sp. ISL-30]
MNYSGSSNEKAVAAGELNRTHIGLTVGFQANETTVVFGRVGAIAKTDGQVFVALDGVAGAGHIQNEFGLPPEQNVYVQPDLLTSTETTIKDVFTKVSESFKGSGQKSEPDQPGQPGM